MWDKAKLNCWELMKCGREPSGKKADELGICSAAEEKKADGIHGGINGGRACWAIAGTLCGGETQGSFAVKISGCRECDFYQQILKEEEAIKDNVDILHQIGYRVK